MGYVSLEELLNAPPDPWWSRTYYWARRQVRRPRELRREVRWGTQRWRRGFSDP